MLYSTLRDTDSLQNETLVPKALCGEHDERFTRSIPSPWGRFLAVLDHTAVLLYKENRFSEEFLFHMYPIHCCVLISTRVMILEGNIFSSDFVYIYSSYDFVSNVQSIKPQKHNLNSVALQLPHETFKAY